MTKNDFEPKVGEVYWYKIYNAPKFPNGQLVERLVPVEILFSDELEPMINIRMSDGSCRAVTKSQLYPMPQEAFNAEE